MPWEAWVTLAVVAGILYSLARSLAGQDVVLLGGAVVLTALGTVSPRFPTPSQLASGFGNEWYVIPIDLDIGTLTKTRSLMITDTFGVQTLISPVNDPSKPATGWSMFELSGIQRKDTPPLRPADPVGKARMRYWQKFTDEHVMNYVSIHGWHRMVGVIARSVESGEFDKLVERIPLYEQRVKWRTARSGFSEADLANATRKIEVAVDKAEQQLKQTKWIAGDMYTLADINFFSMCGLAVQRMFPEMQVEKRAPRLVDWVARMYERPGVKAALAMPNRTNPALRTFTGEAR